MTDEKYFKLNYHSFSRLSNFDKNGPRGINKEYGGDTDAFNLGALVEEILQGDVKSIKAKFIITDNVKPTAQLGQLADAMIASGKDETLENAYEMAKEMNLWAGTKNPDLYTKKIDIPQFWEYLKLQRTNKRIVSPETFISAKSMVKGLLTNEFTDHIFQCEKHEELRNQEVVIWNNDTCKSKFDIIKLNHKTKTITLYDLKTSGFDKERFIGSFYKFRYYLQASMYTTAINAWAFENYPDYLVKPFQFIVVQEADPMNPLVYTVSEPIINSGRDGFVEDSGKIYKKGYEQLIQEYEWHVNNNKFSYSKETYEQKGNIIIE